MNRTTHRLACALVMAGSLIALTGCAGLSQLTGSPTSVTLDGPWRFQRDQQDVGEKLGWNSPSSDDSSWSTMAVPGDWGKDDDGVAWYRTSVTVPESLADRGNLKLIFRKVDDSGTLYLDGNLAAEHHSWNTPFIVDLDRELVSGGKPLAIAIRVKDDGGEGGLLEPVEIRSVRDDKELYASKWSNRRVPRGLDEIGSTVLYSIFVRNFTPEGTFAAAQARLPELRALGVNAVWLIPIHPIGKEKRKGPDGSPYAAADYYDVDPALGTREDFKRFVDAAHAQGIKVLLDCVMRHTAHDSVWAKTHPEWFIRDEQGRPIPRVAAWEDIVDLDWDNPQVREETAKVLEYWVRDFGVDGYRADVADAMPDDWWAMVRRRLDKIRPGVLMLAETESQSCYFHGFDLNYCQSLRDVTLDIAAGKKDVKALRADVQVRQYSFPRGATQMLFVENQDKPRAIDAYLGPERMKAACVLTATLPGVPLLYTGTEVAAQRKRDDEFFTRMPVDFSRDPHGMRPFWQDLLKTRAGHPALQRGDLKVLDAEPAASIFAFERTAADDRVLVVVNMSDKAEKVSLQDPLLPAGGLELPAWGWRIMAR